MSWFVYIAEAKTGNYYVGITTEPARRIIDHNKGNGARMAKSQGPFVLVYTSPELPDQSLARKWEIYLKRWPRGKKTELIIGDIAWSDLVLPELKNKKPSN